MDKNPTTRLFIGSLPYKFNEGQLLSLFAPFGRIISIQVVHNRWGKSRGMGFVEFDDLNAAVDAKVKMHNHLLEDRTIIVDYAEPDPFKTLEGQARHDEALKRHPQRLQKFKHQSPTQAGDRNERPALARSFGKSERSQTSSGKRVGAKKFGPKKFGSPTVSPSNFEHSRQSVYDSRTHHSKVGAKFARKTRQK